LLAVVDMAHERGQRRMHREDDIGSPSRRAELRCAVVVEPELAQEAELAGPVAARAQVGHGLGERWRFGPGGWPKTELAHAPSLCCPIAGLRFSPWPRDQAESISSSWISTSASPISGAKPPRSRSGTSRSSRRSCAPPTARGTATR